jgi:hypothetical protein
MNAHQKLNEIHNLRTIFGANVFLSISDIIMHISVAMLFLKKTLHPDGIPTRTFCSSVGSYDHGARGQFNGNLGASELKHATPLQKLSQIS